MQQLKQRTELINQLISAMKDPTSPGSAVYAGALPTPAPTLHYTNDPVMFSSKIAEALKVVGMGCFGLEVDHEVWVAGQLARLPRRDAQTHLRIQFLHRMIPRNMAVFRTLTQREPVVVHDVNNTRKCLVPIDSYTALDCLRNLVAESSNGTASRAHAVYALNTMKLLTGESWASAIDR